MGLKLNAAMDKDSQVVALEKDGDTRRASSYMSSVPLKSVVLVQHGCQKR
jgi:hypothetical protein